MKDYPHLTEMGVIHPQHIESYSVNSIGYIDVLRIVYGRPKGSLLPHTRTYKFPRVQAKATSAGKEETVMNSSPEFRAAVEELDKVLASSGAAQDVAEHIREELRLLEEDIALRSECIKMLLGKMQQN